MAKKKKTKAFNSGTTEEKIKEAARIVFIKKGFAATRTRDIAEEAGINLALLNYYFRSKARLFELIIMETLSGFIQNIVSVFGDEKTSLQDKVEIIASRYIDMIIKEPEIPTFIITEVRSNPAELMKKLPIKGIITSSLFLSQYGQAVKKGSIAEPNPLHFLMNLMGMILFPFLAKPLITGATGIQSAEFNNLMLERKKLIPVWMKAAMKAQ